MRTPLALALLIAALAVPDAHAHSPLAKKTPAPANAQQKIFGIAGNPAKIDRTVVVSMSDTMRFTPSKISVKLGETVKFVVKNEGRLLHEIVIGTMKELTEHAELMKKHPAMEHDEPYMAHVASAQTGEVVWQFNRAGEFNFACLIAGHFEAGMVGTISVK
jgi:uncharacterized cupredoxin-like copper-binding protein